MINITINNALRLSGMTPGLTDSLKQRFTTVNPAFLEAERTGRYTGHLPQYLFFYRQSNGTLILPRGSISQVIGIIKKSGYPYQFIDNTLRLEPVEFCFNGSLRDYQESALNAVMKRRFGVLNAPTGSGKTIIALSSIAQRKQPALIIVHTRDLLNQWVDRAARFLDIKPGEIGRIENGKAVVKQLTIGTVQSVGKHIDVLKDKFGFLVVDECHRAPAENYREVIQSFSSAFMLGLSATPYRRDGLTKVIYWLCGDQVHSVNAAELRQGHQIETAEVHVVMTGFDYPYSDPQDYVRMISALCDDPARNRIIASTVAQSRKTSTGAALLLSDRKDHCRTLSILLPGSVVLTGDCPSRERERIIDQLASGEISIVCGTTSLLSEGFDEKNVSDIFIASPMKWRGRVIQSVGRALRKQNNKKARIFDFCDAAPVLQNQHRHRLHTYQSTGAKIKNG